MLRLFRYNDSGEHGDDPEYGPDYWDGWISLQTGGIARVSIQPDHWIQRMALEQGMIDPFVPEQVREGVISYGLSSYGYDLRLAREFKVLRPGTEPLDPKAIDKGTFVDVEVEAIDIAPGTFVLGRTVEYLRIPSDVLTLCTGKSSYARCGVLVNVTPFEPGWEGHATLCVINIGPRPVRLYAGEGIAQVIFFRGEEPCTRTYADRAGKYQAVRGVTPNRLG